MRPERLPEASSSPVATCYYIALHIIVFRRMGSYISCINYIICIHFHILSGPPKFHTHGPDPGLITLSLIYLEIYHILPLIYCDGAFVANPNLYLNLPTPAQLPRALNESPNFVFLSANLMSIYEVVANAKH